MSNGNGRRIITIQGPQGAPGPSGVPDVQFVINRDPKLYYNVGTRLVSVSSQLSEDLFVKIRPNNGTTLSIYGKESVVVCNNVDTSNNNSLFVLQQNSENGYFGSFYSNLNSNGFNPPENIKTQIENLKLFLIDHARIRFECVDNFIWNLDMANLDLKFNNIL